jgi:RNA polymerase sigma-54 factor
MSSLSPRLQVRVQQKQILTPGLVQMVSLLQLNRLELKEMISAEVAQNPVLEESLDGVEELTADELRPLLEAERVADPADQAILENSSVTAEFEAVESDRADFEAANLGNPEPAATETLTAPDAVETKSTDPFDEIDFGSYFDDYLDPGYKSPAAENSEKPSFETFLSSPVTLSDHLRSQLALVSLSEEVRDAAESIIGNLNENGYLMATPEEIAASENHKPEDVAEALRVVHTLDPAGVGCADVRECLLLQIESRNGRNGVAWQIVHDHLKLVELRQLKELARVLHRPVEHIQIAVDVIRHLDPRPGLRYSGANARVVEPDVYISKDGERRRYSAATAELTVPEDAGPERGAEQRRSQLCEGTLRFRDSAHEEY